MTDTKEFTALADQFRTALLAPCYRMLGSVEEDPGLFGLFRPPREHPGPARDQAQPLGAVAALWPH